MTEGSSRSVRIELDEGSLAGAGDGVPVAPAPAPRNRMVVVVALLVVAAVAVALIIFRPTAGQSAAGTQRQTPTTTTVLPDGAAAAIPAPTDSVDSAPQPVLFGSDVVRGPTGFLALPANGSVGERPALYRSDDGIRWEEVEVEVPPIETAGIDFVDYSDLIASGQNFAVLRTGFSNEGQGPRRIARITERLVSADGQEWVFDGAFTSVERESGSTPLFHLANAFGFSVEAGVLRAVSRLDCEVLATSPQNAFMAPQQFHRFGRAAPTEVIASTAVSHTQISGARVASFAPNGTNIQLNLCGQARDDLPQEALPAIEVVAPDDTTRQIALPERALEAGDLNEWPEPSLFGTEDGLLVLLGGSVWRLDVGTEQWTWMLDLPAESSELRDYRFVDERFVVGLGESLAIRVDLEREADVTIRPPATLSPESEILYADRDVIIAPSLNTTVSTTRIELPAATLPGPN